MTTPSPQTWTLRLKSRKTTVLLHVDPLHTFATIKTHLYDALKETGHNDPQTNESIELPASPSAIQLGRLVDIHDASKGFQLGEWEYPAYEEEEESGKGKGKAKSGRQSNGVTNAKDCPKGAGLKDGAVLAFKWPGDGTPGQQDDEGIEDMEPDPRNKEADMWGVELARYDDNYGEENVMDVGGESELED
jgi:hypothetical protein